MPQTVFDDASVRSAMRDFLAAADRLYSAAEIGGQARVLLDAAEAKTVAGMQLRKALERQGWTAPTRAGVSSPS
jgi:hypothetical protein